VLAKMLGLNRLF